MLTVGSDCNMFHDRLPAQRRHNYHSPPLHLDFTQTVPTLREGRIAALHAVAVALRLKGPWQLHGGSGTLLMDILPVTS